MRRADPAKIIQSHGPDLLTLDFIERIDVDLVFHLRNHRVHAPACGDVQYSRYVPGTLFPVNSIGIDHIPQLFARNERLAIVQESAVHGRVTTIMVGAIGVGRIGLSFDEVETNRGDVPGVRRYADSSVKRDRGEELGVFHMGSTAIVMTPPECRLEVFAEPGSAVRMGESIAKGSVDER